MKKQLVLGLGLAVLAAPAFASKARLQALGEDVSGSFYINDNRNVFLNAAQVNNHKDLVTMEWGAGAGKEGTDTAPNAEGGAFKTYNNMVYGVQLGRGVEFNEGADDLGVAAFDASNAVDLFVGGDAGFKWGANLTYAAANNKTTTAKEEAQVLDLNLGAIFGDFTAYVNYGVMGSTENKLTTVYDIERSNAVELGGSYQLNDYTIFAQYSMVDFEDKKSKKETEETSYLIGAGRNDKINDKTTLFTKLQYVMSNSADNKPKTTDLDESAIPVVVGLEHDATSWLTLRGSVSQNLWSKSDDSKTKVEKTVANSTNVNAGATLKFGELSIDGVIGTNNNSQQVADLSTTDTNNEKGILSTDNLMTRVSMTYKF